MPIGRGAALGSKISKSTMGLILRGRAGPLAESVLDGAHLVEKAPVIAKLAEKRDGLVERRVTRRRERRRHVRGDVCLPIVNRTCQSLDGCGVTARLRFGKRFALLHHLHQKLWIGFGLLA